jgi:hypothetical protein
MSLDASTNTKSDTIPVPGDDAKKNAKGEELRPHTYWAHVLGYSKRDASAASIIAASHYSVAKMLCKWPNPELDPTHLITEAEFESAIEQATGVHSAQPSKDKGKV